MEKDEVPQFTSPKMSLSLPAGPWEMEKVIAQPVK